MSNSKTEVMGTRKAAEVLGVSVRTVQLWVENGTLKAWKTPGRHRRILRSSVEALLAARDAGAAEPAAGDILIVEDELTMQTYYQALFELLRPGMTLRFANNGFEGLVEFGRHTPKLMLLDLDMPGMDGIELVNALEGREPEDVALVVVTGLLPEQIQDRGGLPEGVPVYAKPLGVDALKEILDASFPVEDREDGGDAVNSPAQPGAAR